MSNIAGFADSLIGAVGNFASNAAPALVGDLLGQPAKSAPAQAAAPAQVAQAPAAAATAPPVAAVTAPSGLSWKWIAAIGAGISAAVTLTIVKVKRK